VAGTQRVAGTLVSPLLGKAIDYSDFDSRRYEHLPKEMQGYAKALSWCRALSFDLSDPFQTQTALLFTMLLSQDNTVYTDYSFFGSAITFLKGASAGPTILELAGLCETLDRKKIFEGISRDYIVHHVMEKASESITPDAHTELVDREPESSPDEAPSLPVTLFGSPRSIAETVFTLFSPTSAADGNHAKGVDLAASFGSGIAAGLLVRDTETAYTNGNNLEKLTRYINSRSAGSWFRNYGDALLFSSSSPFMTPNPAGLFWFDSEGFGKKNLLTFCGSLAASVKPVSLSVTEENEYISNDYSPMSYEYRRDPLPVPRGYIEPHEGFFYNLLLFYNTLITHPAGRLLSATGMAESLAGFFQEVEWIYVMVKNEKSGKPIDQYDYNHIFEIPEIFARCCFPDNFFLDAASVSGGCRVYDMTGLSPLFYSPDGGYVLAVSPGLPQRLLVTVYDPDGGRRICIGFTYSYYELWAGRNTLPSEKQWKSLIRSGTMEKNRLTQKTEPEWAKPD
ncbi:MAG: DUF3160 domain-containing protein, partial [Spirochaetales bacterium]|nr:DUF3160 domain-containing protein [Spirochaetales bacterium]